MIYFSYIVKSPDGKTSGFFVLGFLLLSIKKIIVNCSMKFNSLLNLLNFS